MLAVERRNRIEQIINKNKSVLVVELAKQFEVTTETIRGDLEKLEKQCHFFHTLALDCNGQVICSGH